MYRQYENPRALEKELESKRTDKAWLKERIIHHNITDKPIEVLQEMLFDVCDQISELEQRVNFAWQDEEFG